MPDRRQILGQRVEGDPLLVGERHGGFPIGLSDGVFKLRHPRQGLLRAVPARPRLTAIGVDGFVAALGQPCLVLGLLDLQRLLTPSSGPSCSARSNTRRESSRRRGETASKNAAATAASTGRAETVWQIRSAPSR